MLKTIRFGATCGFLTCVFYTIQWFIHIPELVHTTTVYRPFRICLHSASIRIRVVCRELSLKLIPKSFKNIMKEKKKCLFGFFQWSNAYCCLWSIH